MVDRTIAQDSEAADRKISFEEYLHWPDERRVELVDGRIEYLMPPSIQHQDILFFLNVMFAAFLAKRPLGKVIQAPFAMKIGSKAHGREPDLLFVSAAHTDRLKENYLDGPADLVIEIISPESVERDTVDKFAEYQAGGVTEYVLIDLDKREVRLNRLGDDRKYHLVPPESGRTLRFEVIPGFRLPIAVLWQSPLPDPIQAVELVEAMLRAST
ncbi:MAG: Uma2 family endonuclease [Aggregatilineales bacterium]